MQYFGSKRRIAKYILPIMLAERKPNQCWVEPFVGAANMIDKVTGWRIGNDINRYLIAMLKAVQNGWVPPMHVSKEEYLRIKNHKDQYPDELVGFVGIGCSFGGKWFGSYASNARGDNYARQSRNSILNQSYFIQDVEFVCGDYRKLLIPPQSLIYCDPPYNVKATVYICGKVNHVEFWQWCRDRTKEGHTLFVSEYAAPEDFECIFKIELPSCNNRSNRTEKLFRYNHK